MNIMGTPTKETSNLKTFVQFQLRSSCHVSAPIAFLSSSAPFRDRKHSPSTSSYRCVRLIILARIHLPPPSPHRVALQLQYDGTSFHGWERKPTHIPTVQATVETALSELYHTPISVQAASRTDAGAHALAQVIHYDAPFSLSSNSSLCRSLNKRFPSTIIASNARCVPSSFDARRKAVGRTYRYTLSDCTESVFTKAFCWHVPHALDVHQMNQAVHTLLSYNDMHAFRKTHADATHTTITVRDAGVRRVGPFIHVDITADWFVYGMMRLLTASLVQVGYGKWTVSKFQQILQQKRRYQVKYAVPAKGLCLLDVLYKVEDHPFLDCGKPELNILHPWYTGLT